MLLYDVDARASFSWLWDHRAQIEIGDFVAIVDFYEQSGRRCRGWWPTCPISHGSGLFPKIDKLLRKITEKYMREKQPPSLFIYGDDAKRNNWNSKHYPSYKVPEGYRFFVIKNPDSTKGNDKSVVGVGWVRDGEKIPEDGFNNRGDYIEYV
jgi:hypothetical protein